MDYGFTIFKGILQGLTEFLPVSSTAHLTFVNAFFRMFGWHSTPLRPGEEEFFDIMLHLGTLTAVLIYFRRELIHIFQAVLKPNSLPPASDGPAMDYRKLPWQMALSMTITVVFILSMLEGSEILMASMGWSRPHMEDISDFYFAYPQFVAFHLIITGCLLFYTERASSKGIAGTKPLNWRSAGLIGLFQGCSAIFHGLSRSGSTISAGLATGMDRLTATKYSFLLSIPTFTMAAVYETLKLTELGYIADLNWPEMLAGMAASAIVGYLCVKYFIKFVASNTLYGFAYYCWGMGALMLTIFLTQGVA